MSIFLRSAVLSSLIFFGACGAKEAKSTLPPQPPIWVVSDADSEITLYPTIHILPPEIEWKSDELTRRLADAEEVWFEILPGSETDPALQQMMMQLGMAPGTSVSKTLTDLEVSELKKAIGPLAPGGLTYEVVDQMRPWLVYTFVSVGALVDAGFDPNSGVEKHLTTMTAGKKYRALETAAGQMEMLASMPEQVQMDLLREALGSMDEGIEDMNELVADWAVGDVEDLEDELLTDMKTETPEAYDALITVRNKNWVQQIEKEMKGSGTDFIAVGAGHLVGDDGVPAMLRARGYTVTRL